MNLRVYSMHTQYIHIMYNECTVYRFTCICEYTSIQYVYTIHTRDVHYNECTVYRFICICEYTSIQYFHYTYIHVMYNECTVSRFTCICEYTSIQYLYTIHTFTWCITNVQYIDLSVFVNIRVYSMYTLYNEYTYTWCTL